MYVLILSTDFVRNISLSKNWTRNDNCILVLMYSTSYSCQNLIKLEFSRHRLEKYADIRFDENPSSGSRVAAWRGAETWRSSHSPLAIQRTGLETALLSDPKQQCLPTLSTWGLEQIKFLKLCSLLNTTQGAKSGNPVSQSFITYPSTLYRASMDVHTEWFAFIS
jgi:hypothetical protein